MADIRIADRTIDVLQRSLDLRAQKQQVIAGNIANAETPGYKARKLNFEANLRNAMNSPEMAARTTSAKHFPVGTSGISAVHGTITRQTGQAFGDGNTVSLDDEMLSLAENQLLYETASQIIKKKFSMLKFAASNGR